MVIFREDGSGMRGGGGAAGGDPGGDERGASLCAGRGGLKGPGSSSNRTRVRDTGPIDGISWLVPSQRDVSQVPPP